MVTRKAISRTVSRLARDLCIGADKSHLPCRRGTAYCVASELSGIWLFLYASRRRAYSFSCSSDSLASAFRSPFWYAAYVLVIFSAISSGVKSSVSRVEAGSGNHQLVDEGYAIRLTRGVYALAPSQAE